jgi:hypothetical protein
MSKTPQAMGGTHVHDGVSPMVSVSATLLNNLERMPHHAGPTSKSYLQMVEGSQQKNRGSAVPFALQAPDSMKMINQTVKDLLSLLKSRIPTSFPRPNWLPNPFTPLTSQSRPLPGCMITFDKPPRSLNTDKVLKTLDLILGQETASQLIQSINMRGKHIEVYWNHNSTSSPFITNQNNTTSIPQTTNSNSITTTPLPITTPLGNSNLASPNNQNNLTTNEASIEVLEPASERTNNLPTKSRSSFTSNINNQTSSQNTNINTSLIINNNNNSNINNNQITYQQIQTQQQKAMIMMQDQIGLFLQNEVEDGATKAKINRLDAVHYHLVVIKGVPTQWSLQTTTKILFTTLNIPWESLARAPYAEHWGPQSNGSIIYLPYTKPQTYFIALATAKEFKFQIGETTLEWDYGKPPNGYRRWCGICVNPHYTKDCPLKEKVNGLRNRNNLNSNLLDIEQPKVLPNEQAMNSLLVKPRMKFEWKRARRDIRKEDFIGEKDKSVEPQVITERNLVTTNSEVEVDKDENRERPKSREKKKKSRRNSTLDEQKRSQGGKDLIHHMSEVRESTPPVFMNNPNINDKINREISYQEAEWIGENEEGGISGEIENEVKENEGLGCEEENETPKRHRRRKKKNRELRKHGGEMEETSMKQQSDNGDVEYMGEKEVIVIQNEGNSMEHNGETEVEDNGERKECSITEERNNSLVVDGGESEEENEYELRHMSEADERKETNNLIEKLFDNPNWEKRRETIIGYYNDSNSEDISEVEQEIVKSTAQPITGTEKKRMGRLRNDSGKGKPTKPQSSIRYTRDNGELRKITASVTPIEQKKIIKKGLTGFISEKEKDLKGKDGDSVKGSRRKLVMSTTNSSKGIYKIFEQQSGKQSNVANQQ